MRTFAKKNGMKLNNKGLWKGPKLIASKKEEDIFRALGMKYVPPEKREIGRVAFGGELLDLEKFRKRKDSIKFKKKLLDLSKDIPKELKRQNDIEDAIRYGIEEIKKKGGGDK